VPSNPGHARPEATSRTRTPCRDRPPTLDARAVRAALRERPEVLRVSDFHLWALAPGKVMLSAIVLTTPTCDDTDDVLVDLQKVCAYRFDLHHCTFQVTKDPKLA
jgi:Co/Zn/Cd efflux system component